MARRLAGPVGGGEAKHHRVHSHVLLVVDAGVLAHELGRVIDAHRMLRQVLGHRLVRRVAVFAQHRPIDALGAGVDDPLHVEGTRGFQHVHGAHHVDLDAERGIRLRHGADERGGVDDVRDPVRLHHLQEPRHVEHVAELDVDFVEEVADQPFVAVTRIDHRTMSFGYELAAGLGADDAHAAGDEHLHFSAPSPC